MFIFEGNDFWIGEYKAPVPGAWDKVRADFLRSHAPWLRYPRFIFNAGHRAERALFGQGGATVEIHVIAGR